MKEKIKIFKKELFVVSGYILLSIYATFPVILKFNSAFYGMANDPLAWMWKFWWLKHSHVKGLDSSFCNILAYPFGVKMPVFYPIWEPIYRCLSILTGEVITYNLQIMSGFFLSGLAMYMLVFYCTKNRLASFFAGVVLMLCPYHFARSWEHLGLANMHWMVFYMLSLFILNKERTYKSAIICGLCLGLISHLSNLYYLYFMLIFSAIFIIYKSIYRIIINKKVQAQDGFKAIKLAAIVIIIAFVMILPQINSFTQNLASGSEDKFKIKDISRPFSQLFADSARPLNYFLPTEYNPILGGLTRFFVGTPLYGENSGGEQSLYLGIIPLFFAFIGYKKWQDKKHAGGLESKQDFLIRFWSMVFLAFMICSFSPYFRISSNFFIPFPSYFLYKIFPMFRNYARMGAVVMIAVCVLAGFGLKAVLETFSSRRKQFAVVSLVCCAVLFEFLNIPPYRITNVNKIPEACQWMREQPEETVIAEYPIDADERPYLFYQRIHEKSLVNGAPRGTYADEVRQKILDIENGTTAGILSFLGAKYVLVHKDRYRNYEGGVILGGVPDLTNQKGLKLKKIFPNTDIYEVTAQPLDPKTVSLIKKEIKTNVAEINPKIYVPATFAFEAGEEFTYSIKYMKVIPAATIRVAIGAKNKLDAVDVVPLEAELYINKLISYFIKIDAHVISLFDIQHLCSRQYKEISQAQGHRLNNKVVDFDQKNAVMSVKDKQVKIYPCTQDPLSAMFFLSSQKFERGKKIAVNLNPGKSNYKLECEVLGKDLLKLRGKVKACWKVKAEYFQLKNSMKKIADVTMWFEDTDKKTLILIEAITKVGFLSVERRR
ncbi:MAG: DUF3108 domain-containing protein [Candidatus Omnitrophota bacterium]